MPITGNSAVINHWRPVLSARSVKPTAKKLCWLLHKLTERYPRTPGNMTAVFKYIAMLAGELVGEGRLQHAVV